MSICVIYENFKYNLSNNVKLDLSTEPYIEKYLKYQKSIKY